MKVIDPVFKLVNKTSFSSQSYREILISNALWKYIVQFFYESNWLQPFKFEVGIEDVSLFSFCCNKILWDIILSSFRPKKLSFRPKTRSTIVLKFTFKEQLWWFEWIVFPTGKISWIDVTLTSVSDVRFTLVFGWKWKFFRRLFLTSIQCQILVFLDVFFWRLYNVLRTCMYSNRWHTI